MKPATTVTKVCRVLGEFKHRPSLGITDLARRLELFPSDIHRILTSLQIYGYVEQNPETKRYQLGTGLLRLGITTFQRNVVQEKGRVILSRLAKQLNAATHLAMFDVAECEVFLLDQVDFSPEPIFKAQPGATTLAHSTALGKTILAEMDPQTFKRVLDRTGLRKSTKWTITDLPTLEIELQLIRQRGFAVDREESAEGACCIGCPVRNCTGIVIGAIGASMRANHFQALNLNRLASHVDAAAAELSFELGFDGTALGERRHAG
jgi:IclR family transcriptional regulator, KDG regulon repressor